MQPEPPPIEEVPEEPKPMSEVARLFGVFFSPGAAFADIAKRPRWWVPILVLAILGIGVTYVFNQKVGFDVAIRQAMDRNPQALQLNAQQRENLIRLQTNVVKYIAYGGVVVTTVFYFVIALILLFLFNTILGADIRLKQMMAVVTYGALPQILVSLLTVAVIFMKPPEDIDFQNPLAFNAAAFLPEDAPGWLRGFCTPLDLFNFWMIGLLGIGVSRAARKISTAKAIVTILFPWSLWVALRTAIGMFQG